MDKLWKRKQKLVKKHWKLRPKRKPMKTVKKSHRWFFLWKPEKTEEKRKKKKTYENQRKPMRNVKKTHRKLRRLENPMKIEESRKVQRKNTKREKEN